MRLLADVPMGTLLKRIGLAVLVGLVTVAAIGALVNSAGLDADQKDDTVEEWERNVAGCKTGNVVRAQLRTIGDVAGGTANVIVVILESLTAQPGPNADPEDLEFLDRQVEILRTLSTQIDPPGDRDCLRIYGPPPDGAQEPPDPVS